MRTRRRTVRRRRGERENSAVICYFKDKQLGTGYWAPISNGVGAETKLHFGL
jgi:hypothetical protein